MNAIQVRKQIESETLHLPELREMIGKTVQITIREEVEPLETERTFLGRSPERFISAKKQDADRQRLEEEAKGDPALAALTIAAAGGPDVDAVISLRARG